MRSGSRSASTVILAHNHPSGIALPSDDDCAATTRAAQALQTIGVALADHIIVADDDFVSMAQSLSLIHIFINAVRLSTGW